MRYRTLGTTGVKVSVLGLGAMKLGGRFTTDPGECRAIVHRALDAGINLIDTADIYGRGESERIVGAAIAGRRDDVVLATKAHHAMGRDPNMRGNSKRWLARACEASLARLATDHIDLFQLHRPDPAEDDVLPACQRHGIGVLSYSPLAGGWLARPSSAQSLPALAAGQRADQYERKVAATVEVARLAAEAGLDVAHVALAWVLEHPAISSAIIGPRTLEQLVGLVPAADASIAPDLLAAIDAVVPPGTTLVREDVNDIWRYGSRINPYPDGWRQAAVTPAPVR